MKRLMGALAFAATTVICFAGSASADLEAVKTEFGSLEIGGLFQMGLNYYIGDEFFSKENPNANSTSISSLSGTDAVGYAVDRGSDMEFVLTRVRFKFKGTVVSDHIGYFAQIDYGRQEGPRLLDARLAFSYIPYTTLAMGRFLPNFTYWLPMQKSHTFLIDLPLMNSFLGEQRQTGLNIGVIHKYFEVNMGIFNGRNEPNLSINPADRAGKPLGENTDDQWGDENTAKDACVSLAVKPIDGLRAFGGYWYGQPLDYFFLDKGEKKAHNANVGIVDAGAAYLTHWGLRLWGEYMIESVAFDKKSSVDGKTGRPANSYKYSAASWYAMGGYNFSNQGVPLELLARYDWLDPDTANDDVKHPGSVKDQMTYITAGLNYYIEGNNAMLYLNYIYKSEQYKVMKKAGDGTQTGIADDELKLQVQVAF